MLHDMQRRFDEWLEAKLQERAWQAADLARAGIDADHPRGFDPGLISRWRKAPPIGVIPTAPTLDRLARVLGVERAEVYAAAGRLSPDEPTAESAQAQVSAQRQRVRDELDRWLTAVGPENEEFFWEYLKTHGETGVALIKRVGTAVNAGAEGAVNAAVSARAQRGRKRRDESGGSLTPTSRPRHSSKGMLDVGAIRPNQRQAA